VTADEALTLIRQRCGVEPAREGALLSVTVEREQWAALGALARRELGCVYFNWLSAVDWKEQGLEVLARVENLDAGFAVMMRTRLPAGDATCPSLVGTWRGADWHERECYDLLGVTFAGHPDLRRILLGDDWVGHPLRKDWVDTGVLPYR
jgi:NADH-quinone oxidoreductase subunit C